MRLSLLCFAALASSVAAQRFALPAPPPGNQPSVDRFQLGKVLFWDEQLSSNGTVACGTCHQPAAGGADPRALDSDSVHPGPDGFFGTPDDIRGSRGVVAGIVEGPLDGSTVFGMREQVTSRLAPTAINAALFRRQLWDGSVGDAFVDPQSGFVTIPHSAGLEGQSVGPPVNTVEMAHAGEDWDSIAVRLTGATPLALATDVPTRLDNWIGDASYPELFERAFGDPEIDAERIAMAIAQYERQLISNQAPLDQYIAGVESALSPLELDGLQVFMTARGRCIFCHTLFDFAEVFSATGVRPLDEDPGLFAVTGEPFDLGRFKVPFLANLSLRPAFFHDGSATTLEEVVDFYDRGGNGHVQNALIATPLGLTDYEKQALVAFLSESLTDPRVASETAPFDRPTLFSERQHGEAFGTGTQGTFAIVPELVALEPPVLGNPHYTVGLGRAAAGRPAILLFDIAAGDGSAAFSGAPLWVGLTPQLLAFDLGPLRGRRWGDGYASWSIEVPTLPSLDGLSIFLQGLIADYGAPHGVAATAGQRIEFFAPR